jgi:prepilin-type N-terminal cleavage/methylation domain-containing protein
MKNNAGFTLIELLITISIIVIIAAVSVPGIISYQNKQNEDRLVLSFINLYRNYQQLALSKDSTMKIQISSTNSDITFCDGSKCEVLKITDNLFNQDLTFNIDKYGNILNQTLSPISSDLVLSSLSYKITINKYGGIIKTTN